MKAGSLCEGHGQRMWNMAPPQRGSVPFGKKIRRKRAARGCSARHPGLGETLGDDMAKAYRAAMDEGRHTVDPVLTNFKSKYAVDWSPFLGKTWTDAGDTAIPL